MRVRKWRDIDVDFMPGGKSSDLVAVSDVAAIKQQMTGLLSMERYDDPFHPETAVGLRKLLFEQATPQTEALLKMMIEAALKNWVDRIDLIDVGVDQREKETVVDVKFKIRDIPEIQNYRTVLKRVR